MPFICDVCGEEVSYSEPVFKLRNNAEIVICTKCIKKELKASKKKKCNDTWNISKQLR